VLDFELLKPLPNPSFDLNEAFLTVESTTASSSLGEKSIGAAGGGFAKIKGGRPRGDLMIGDLDNESDLLGSDSINEEFRGRGCK